MLWDVCSNSLGKRSRPCTAITSIDKNYILSPEQKLHHVHTLWGLIDPNSYVLTRTPIEDIILIKDTLNDGSDITKPYRYH